MHSDQTKDVSAEALWAGAFTVEFVYFSTRQMSQRIACTACTPQRRASQLPAGSHTKSQSSLIHDSVKRLARQGTSCPDSNL